MDYTLSNNIYAPDHTFPAPTPHDLSHLGGPYGETQPLPYSPGAWDSTLLPSNLQHSSDSLTEIQQMAPVPLSRIDVCNPINIAGETSEETYTSSSLRPHKRKRTAQGISTMSELGVQMNHCHFSDSAYGRSVDTRSVPGDYSGGYHFNAMEPTDTADTPSVYSDFDTYLPLVNLQPEPTPATPPVSQISDHSNSRSLPRQRLTSKRPQWKCDVPNCDKSLRTKSEYK